MSFLPRPGPRSSATADDASDLRAARDPSATGDVLVALAQRTLSPAVCAAVAAHPNTPLATLVQLAAQYPRAVFANSSFTLLPVEAPHLLAALDAGVMPTMLRALAGEVTDEEHAADDTGVAARQRFEVPLGAPVAPRWFVEHAVRHPDPCVRGNAARSPVVPLALLSALALDPTADVRRALAERHDMPEALAPVLARDADTRIRCAVARSLRGHEALLQELARDPDEDVVCAVASNAVAPRGLLLALARDPRLAVRRALVEQQGSREVLAALADDEDPSVSLRAKVTLRGVSARELLAVEDGRLAERMDAYCMVWLLESQQAPDWLLPYAARHANTTVRAVAAGAPRMPEAEILTLARDPRPGVRMSVAQRQVLSDAVYSVLAGDPDAAVQDRLARHRRGP